MAQKRVTDKTYNTTKFVIYCYTKNPKPGKEEGTVWITDNRHKLVERNERHFDNYDEIGGIVREFIADRTSVGSQNR